MMFGRSTSASWKNIQSCTRRTTKFKLRAAQDGEGSKTYCFSSTGRKPNSEKRCTSKLVCVCVFSSVTALHGDYCVMWITWHRWVFSVVQRASGVRQKGRPIQIQRDWESLPTLCGGMHVALLHGLTRQCCPLVSTVRHSYILNVTFSASKTITVSQMIMKDERYKTWTSKLKSILRCDLSLSSYPVSNSMTSYIVSSEKVQWCSIMLQFSPEGTE